MFKHLQHYWEDKINFGLENAFCWQFVFDFCFERAYKEKMNKNLLGKEIIFENYKLS